MSDIKTKIIDDLGLCLEHSLRFGVIASRANECGGDLCPDCPLGVSKDESEANQHKTKHSFSSSLQYGAVSVAGCYRAYTEIYS